ncbi:hypothetical protein CEXT_232941 [Caerostris extrusa]|uniref:Uncharacterized protein n=1 Tax=Caerostris extrusa TaxID=172846 RepID=A0AAV4VKJ8_CAEEX|nr:hypothetical protein CEXT_232941 [Caerostris extrusa]
MNSVWTVRGSFWGRLQEGSCHHCELLTSDDRKVLFKEVSPKILLKGKVVAVKGDTVWRPGDDINRFKMIGNRFSLPLKFCYGSCFRNKGFLCLMNSVWTLRGLFWGRLRKGSLSSLRTANIG